MSPELISAYGRMLMPEDGFAELGMPRALFDGTVDSEFYTLDLTGLYEILWRQFDRGASSGASTSGGLEECSSSSSASLEWDDEEWGNGSDEAICVDEAEEDKPDEGDRPAVRIKTVEDLRLEHQRIRDCIEYGFLRARDANSMLRSLAEDAKLLRAREGQGHETSEGIPVEILRAVARASPEALNALAPLASRDQIADLLQESDGDD